MDSKKQVSASPESYPLSRRTRIQELEIHIAQLARSQADLQNRCLRTMDMLEVDIIRTGSKNIQLEKQIAALREGLEESREDMLIINRCLKRRQANNQLDSSKYSSKLSNSLSCGQLLSGKKSAVWERFTGVKLNKNFKNSYLL